VGRAQARRRRPRSKPGSCRAAWSRRKPSGAGRPGRRAAQQLPDWKTPCAWRRLQANEQRGSVTQVQQQIQVLAAEQRSIEEQSRQLTSAANAGSRPQRAGRARRRRWQNMQAQLAGSTRKPPLADARLHELQDALPQLDEARRASSKRQRPNRRARPICLPAWRRSRPCRKKSTDGKLQPWLAKHGWTACRACGAASTSSRAGKTPGGRAARAPGHWKSPLDMVRSFASDAPPAKLSFFSPPLAAAPKPLPAAAPGGSAASARCRPESACWPTGCRAATPQPAGRRAGPARQAAGRARPSTCKRPCRHPTA
jgi:chromosome segregation protein